MAFKERLREAREKAGLDQNELAKLVGNITNSSISNYEKGTSFPKTEVLFKLFNVLGTTPNFLFQDEIDINKISKMKKNISKKEEEIIDKYNSLDAYGKNLIDKILELECERCKNDLKNKPKINDNSDYENEYHEILGQIGKKIINDMDLAEKK